MMRVWPVDGGRMVLGFESSTQGCRTLSGNGLPAQRLCSFLAMFVLWAVFVIGEAAAAGPRLQVLTEEWPPVSYTLEGRPTGMAVEIVSEVLRRAGRDEAIEFVPWSRGYKLVTEVPNVILFPMARSPERERLVTMIGPLLEVRTELYQRRGDHWNSRLQEAKASAIVGSYRASHAEASARREGFRNLSLAASPDRSARMLLSGRVDLWADSHISAAAALRSAGGDVSVVERVAILDVNPLMIAVSPGTSSAIIKAFEDALREMKGDGTFQRIYGKWFPAETLPAQLLGVERVGRKQY